MKIDFDKKEINGEFFFKEGVIVYGTDLIPLKEITFGFPVESPVDLKLTGLEKSEIIEKF